MTYKGFSLFRGLFEYILHILKVINTFYFTLLSTKEGTRTKGEGDGWVIHRPPLDLPLRKKRIPPTGGEMNRKFNEQKKYNKAACGMHAASLISPEEGLRGE